MSEHKNQAGHVREDGDGIRSSGRQTKIPARKPYSPPLLAHEEHLRDITLAPTPYESESGGIGGFGPDPNLSSPNQSGSTDSEMFESFFDNE